MFESLSLCKMPLLVSVWAFFVFGTIAGTKTGKRKTTHTNRMVKDLSGDKPFKRAVLRDRGGDLTKEWYIEYYAFDESLNDLVRKRIKIPTSFQTKKARMAEAVKLITETNLLLESGYHFKTVKTDIGTGLVKDSSKDLIVVLEKVLGIIKPSLRPKTAGTYQSAINKLKAYADSKVLELPVFTDKDAIKFRDYLRSGLKNTARTANNTLIHLHTLYGHVKERVNVGDSPFQLKKLKQGATNKNIAFTDEDRARVEKYMLLNEPEL